MAGITQQSAIAKALTEPTDRRKIFIGWDAAKGWDQRRMELCARIRSEVNTKLRFHYKAVMRHQSFWRLIEPTEKLLNQLAEDIQRWEKLHREGDPQWWALTKEKILKTDRAKDLGVANPTHAKEVPNPWFGSDEKPDCHADYRIFPMGESETAEVFGIALEMETLSKWAASITESAQKAIQAQKTTKQLQNSLKRKLEGLLEFLKEYGETAPRHKEISDECMIADDLIRKADELIPSKKA